MLIGMPKVGKVTVSLPVSILEYVEDQRARTGATRSETVARMLSEARQQTELREREARYAAAYARLPETDEESAWTEATTKAFFADAPRGEWGDVAPPTTAGPAPRLPRAASPPATAKAARGAADDGNIKAAGTKRADAARMPAKKAAKRAPR
jgi:hypothetical protein